MTLRPLIMLANRCYLRASAPIKTGHDYWQISVEREASENIFLTWLETRMTEKYYY